MKAIEPRLEIGELIASRYQIKRRVGEGSFGQVWLGVDIETKERVALKMLHALSRVDAELVTRFRREAYFQARVRSDHIAKILDFFEDPKFGLVLVLQFVEGESLAKIFERRTIELEEAIDIGLDVLIALMDLHAAHIIHRDLKPGNVMLSPTPDGGQRAVVCDLGASRLLAHRFRRGPGDRIDTPSMTELTKANDTLGTLKYMAPEQILNSREVTEVSDLYALGAILYRGVAGHNAFDEEDTPQTLARAKVSREAYRLETGRTGPMAQAFEDFVARSMRRRPADRYRNAVQMHHELVRVRELARASASHSRPSGGANAVDADPDVPLRDPLDGPPSFPPRPPSPRSAPPPASLPPPRSGPPQRSGARAPILVVLVALAVFPAGVIVGRLWQSHDVILPSAEARPAAQPAASATASTDVATRIAAGSANAIEASLRHLGFGEPSVDAGAAAAGMLAPAPASMGSTSTTRFPAPRPPATGRAKSVDDNNPY